MRFRLLAVSVLASFAFQGIALADTPAKAPAWEQFDQEDGILMFRRDVPGSDVVALRGEGFVPAPIARVASVLIDRKRATEWIDRLVKTKELRKISETESINWNHIKTPTPLKDRDFVFKTVLTTDPAKKQVLFSYYSVKDSAAPETDDYVRGYFQQSKLSSRWPRGKTKTAASPGAPSSLPR